MPILDATGVVPSPDALAAAELALRAGEVVVLPTDTVYGVAVDPRRPHAVDRLFALKRRPRDAPLAVLVERPQQGLEWADLARAHRRTADALRRFWPGGLTAVLPRAPGLDVDLGTAGDTIGIRCPAHPVPRALAGRIGPLAVTSANLRGAETPPTAAAVAAQLELDDRVVVLDGGPCTGAASTVVDFTGAEPSLVREGAVPWTAVHALLL